MKRLALVAIAAMVLGACQGSDPAPGSSGTLLVAVNAPFSRSPFIGQTIYRGVKLAVDEINANGGAEVGTKRYQLEIRRYDNALSPQKAAENVRRAIDDGAIAIIDEGTGIDASWRIAEEADVPICIVYQGGRGLIDPQGRPNVFRVAPTDRGVAFRLAEYLIPKGVKVAFMYDDSDYGQQGKIAFEDSWGRVEDSIAARISVPADAGDVAPQVLRARRSNATALLVWARSPTLAQVIRAARTSGWDVPIYAPPSGEDPFVRQQLSDHPEWIEGFTFASGRMTAEKGPKPFLNFRAKYEEAFGPDEIGIQTSDGQEIIQPPDYAMYPYDFVNVLNAALKVAREPRGAALLDALNQVDIVGANGDERGFNEISHEGVVDDDVYFAVYGRDLIFRPVEDDLLSSTLPAIDQTE